jgi:hypothetical protein
MGELGLVWIGFVQKGASTNKGNKNMRGIMRCDAMRCADEKTRRWSFEENRCTSAS